MIKNGSKDYKIVLKSKRSKVFENNLNSPLGLWIVVITILSSFENYLDDYLYLVLATSNARERYWFSYNKITCYNNYENDKAR